MQTYLNLVCIASVASVRFSMHAQPGPTTPTNDGILDNGDIGAFVSAFLAGC